MYVHKYVNRICDLIWTTAAFSELYTYCSLAVLQICYYAAIRDNILLCTLAYFSSLGSQSITKNISNNILYQLSIMVQKLGLG